MGRKQKFVIRPDEPKQRTKRGLEIPVPARDDFLRTLDKAAKTPPEKSSSRGRAKR